MFWPSQFADLYVNYKIYSLIIIVCLKLATEKYKLVISDFKMLSLIFITYIWRLLWEITFEISVWKYTMNKLLWFSPNETKKK